MTFDHEISISASRSLEQGLGTKYLCFNEQILDVKRIKLEIQLLITNVNWS